MEKIVKKLKHLKKVFKKQNQEVFGDVNLAMEKYIEALTTLEQYIDENAYLERVAQEEKELKLR